MGKNTDLNKRYDFLENKPKKGYEPINKIDEIS